MTSQPKTMMILIRLSVRVSHGGDTCSHFTLHLIALVFRHPYEAAFPESAIVYEMIQFWESNVSPQELHVRFQRATHA